MSDKRLARASDDKLARWWIAWVGFTLGFLWVMLFLHMFKVI